MTLADVVLAKKWELDALRQSLPADALANLENNHRIGVTYASNAIDGNALTAGETALILENGVTFPGKSLKDHLEVAEHAGALAWVLDTAGRTETPITDGDIRYLHRLVVGQAIPEISGRYADRARRLEFNGNGFEFPSPEGVPGLMASLRDWFSGAPNEPAAAFEAQFLLLAIHPFNDGNGRTARLVTNWMLARSGFPLIAIHPENKSDYLAAIAAGLPDNDASALSEFLFERLDRTLDTFLAAARQARDTSASTTHTRT